MDQFKMSYAVAVFLTALSASTSAFAQQTTVTIAREADPSTYDPHRSTARPAAETGLMFGDTLVSVDYDFKTIVPFLAKSWSISEDGKVYTFQIRNDVTFCSGKALKAQDVVASYERWRDPATAGVARWRMGPVDKITALDDYTVEYRLKQPYSDLLYQMATFQHTIINAEYATKMGADFGVKGMDATGPYCFHSWTPRVETVLTRHKGYKWGPAIKGTPVEPGVERVVFKPIIEESTRVSLMRSGGADVAGSFPYWSIPEFKKSPNVNVLTSDIYFNAIFAGFRTSRELGGDAVVRKAVNLAISAKNITEVITFGLADPAYTFISPKAKDFNTSLELSEPEDGPKQAVALLEKAGWSARSDGFRYKGGKRLKLVLYGFNGFQKDITEAMQNDLRAVGIELEINLFDPTAAWSMLATNNYDMFMVGNNYMTAGDMLNAQFPQNGKGNPSTDYENPRLMSLLAKASAAIDDRERVESYAEAQKIIHDENLFASVYHDNRYFLVNKRLKPFKGHGISGASLYKGLGFAWQK